MTIHQAAKALKSGKIVAFPTETVYGLGACVFSEQAIAQIFKLKGRPSDNPLIVHISSLGQLDELTSHIPRKFYALAAHFFPGPLTIILPKSPLVPHLVSGGLETVAIRMPSHPIAHALIKEVGVPLVAPSANLSGRPSSTAASHVKNDFGDQVMVLEGECGHGLESTVLLLEPTPTILRPGPITAPMIEEVLGEEVLGEEVVESTGKSETPLSPGMKYRHYAPDATVKLVEVPFSVKDGERLIHPTNKTLYHQLRQADLDQITTLYVVCDESVRCNRALMNRLMKAVSR